MNGDNEDTARLPPVDSEEVKEFECSLCGQVYATQAEVEDCEREHDEEDEDYDDDEDLDDDE